VIGADLLRAAGEVPPNVAHMRKLLEQAKEQHLHMDRKAIAFALARSVESLAERLWARPEDPSSYVDLDRAVEFAERAGFVLDLWRTQNLFYGLAQAVVPSLRQRAEAGDAAAYALGAAFQSLADRLRVRLPAPQ